MIKKKQVSGVGHDAAEIYNNAESLVDILGDGMPDDARIPVHGLSVR